MNNCKATKRALLTSVMALVMCVVMLVGTTFAWFTDTATANVNKIEAGKLDVELLDKDGNSVEGQTLSFVKAAGGAGQEILWEPGATYQLPELQIKNAGNLALKYKINVSGAKVAAGAPADSLKLLDVLEWTYEVNGVAYTLDSEKHLTAKGTTNDSDTLVIKATMDKNANNDYQGMAIEGIAITVYATQDTVEYDSNGNTYDEKAEYAVEVKTADELHKALENDDNVVLATDIALPDDWTPAGNGTRSGAFFTGDSYTGIFNGNGKTISNVKNSLFGVVTGTVKNVKIEAAIHNTESDSVGAVAGILAGGTVSDVKVSGGVTANEATGGIVGRILAEGTVSNCMKLLLAFPCKIAPKGTVGGAVGGIEVFLPCMACNI